MPPEQPFSVHASRADLFIIGFQLLRIRVSFEFGAGCQAAFLSFVMLNVFDMFQGWFRTPHSPCVAANLRRLGEQRLIDDPLPADINKITWSLVN